MTQRPWQQKLWMAIGLISVVLLGAAVFTLGSLNAPVHALEGNGLGGLFAVSIFVSLAFVVFGLVLTRSLIRMWAERRAGQLGSRFKTKMVLGAMGVSLLPLVFLFLFSYSLVNRTLNLWFPRPLEIANEESQHLLGEMSREAATRLNAQAAEIAARLPKAKSGETLQLEVPTGLDAVWIADSSGKIVSTRGGASGSNGDLSGLHRLPNAADFWQNGADVFRAGYALWNGGQVYVGRKLPADYLLRYSEIQAETKTYMDQRQQLRQYKRQILVALLLITLLLLFSTSWVGLFLSKQVTLPIQALAEATAEVAHGNFEHRVDLQAQDELGTLVSSFNEMTAQLGEGRRQINEFTRNLQLAVEERERRRKLMEAILENIPTGVLSLDSGGAISRANSAVTAIFGERAGEARTLQELFGEEASRAIAALVRRSLRMGVASREMEIAVEGRLVRTAVTVSSLGPRRSNLGFVVVIDDLTELLRAQKAAAWQEVAQRIAHEIKNPLTPIMLSAQRLLRHLERTGQASEGANAELEGLVAECAGLIEQEVQTLESLVDEFSQFVRFPSARLVPADVNSIVSSALAQFHDRLEGVMLETHLALRLPPVKADGELLRRVIANLVDNAAEAMEGSTIRQLRVATRSTNEGEGVEIEISDTGHGISPQDKDRLFLPHFSTKERGTGLGLAIAARIVAEHNGTLRVEDNEPSGARFLIRFPAAETVPVATNGSAAIGKTNGTTAG